MSTSMQWREEDYAPGRGGSKASDRLGGWLQRLANRGCALIIADVWRDAEAFYRARGWAPPAAVLLRKRLPRPGANR